LSYFSFSERDLDLIILEELHAGNGFADWLAAKAGLSQATFLTAQHSVSATVSGKTGETDVLAFLQTEAGPVALMIEDKIGADFTERQAERYHERGRALVAAGKAVHHVTLLCAPAIYLQEVPEADPWGIRLPIEEIQSWFERQAGRHAKWRSAVLQEVLEKVRRSALPAREEVVRFRAAYSDYLVQRPELGLSTTRGSDPWGVILKSAETPTHVQLAHKLPKGRMDLTFYGPHCGKIKRLESLPADVHVLQQKTKSDMLFVSVPLVYWHVPFEDQVNQIAEALDARLLLLPLVLEILKL
jgi:hypothetical protein